MTVLANSCIASEADLTVCARKPCTSTSSVVAS